MAMKWNQQLFLNEVEHLFAPTGRQSPEVLPGGQNVRKQKQYQMALSK